MALKIITFFFINKEFENTTYIEDYGAEVNWVSYILSTLHFQNTTEKKL